MKDHKKLLLLFVLCLVLIVLYLSLGLNSRNWDYALPRRVPKLLAIVITEVPSAFLPLCFKQSLIIEF